ncbi:MAG: hypothetical protein BRC28_04015 [Nanohaloarchaea archaeon SW_4_43_9]|nr:MAG: hypothetical protein BRC28_04015 [Nanohaloarchaea archaeon SW_4_43_9]
MKGQYLAVESVLVVAMGLTLAIGTISIFGNYQVEEEMKLVTAQKQYVTPLHNLNEYKLQGSVKGGTVILYKTGNQYTLRAS